MKSQTLSKSDIKVINAELLQSYGVEPLNKKELATKITSDLGTFIRVKTEMKFFYHNKKIIPLLKSLQQNNFLKCITVDMGAVKFVISGADIMKPGIVDIDDDIKEGDVIAVIDQNNKKPLALGVALFSTEDMRSQEKGKSIQNIHYVGDKIWEENFK